MKELHPLPSLSSIYPSYHAQLFSPVLSHHQQPSSPSFSFCKDSTQAVVQGLVDEDEDEDENGNGYFAGLARLIVCSMLDEEDTVVVVEEEEAFVSEESEEDNHAHSPNVNSSSVQLHSPFEIGGDVFELRVTQNNSLNRLNLLLDSPPSLLPCHGIEEEVAVVATSLNAKEPQLMLKDSTRKKKQKKKKGKQGKQQLTAKDEEVIIDNSKVLNGMRGGAYEGRAGHCLKKETWKDYRSPPAFAIHTLVNRSNGGGSTFSSGGTGVFLPRSYAPCTDTSQTRSSLSCSTMHQAWPCLVSPPPEKETILPSLSYAAVAVGSGIRGSNWKSLPPFPSSLSSCSPLEHITADISLPVEWTY